MATLSASAIADRVTAASQDAAVAVAVCQAVVPASLYPCGDVVSALALLRDLFIVFH